MVTATTPGTVPQRATLPAAAAGAWHMAPLLSGLVPFGVAIGVAIAASPLDHAVGWATGPVLFSGASQLTAIELLGSGAGALSVVLSLLVLNARFVLYSAALAPALDSQPTWFRWVAPYFIVDPVVATASDPSTRGHDDAWWRWHYLGAAGTLWVAWVGAIAVGIVAGPAIDPALGLEFAAPLCLLALLARRLRDRSNTLPAVAGAATATLALVVPTALAVLLAMAAGSTVAAVTGTRRA
jgi:predicted branched-subunit amino acid permease